MSTLSIRFARLITGLLLMAALAGCGSLPFLAQPTATPAPTHTPLPTTPLPTSTPTLAPTATYTPLPSPTLAPALPTEPPAEPTVVPTVDPALAIKVYYINLKENGPFGCGEALWYITTRQAKTASVENDIKFALSTILNYHNDTIGILYNPGYAASISVNGVQINGGNVTVQLSGTWTRTKDNCDGRRFIDQLRQTIKQFSGVSGIQITLNGTPISDALSRK